MNFQVPTTTTAASSFFGLGAAPTANTNTAGAAGGMKPAPMPLSFGIPKPQDASSGEGAKLPTFDFGAAATNAAATTTTAAAGGLGGLGGGGNFLVNPATATTAAAATTSVAPSNFSFGAAPMTSAATLPTFSLPKANATQTAAASTAAATAPTSATATGGFASLSTATKTTDSAAANAAQLNYNQLEEHINKWTLELEEQEKVFTDQATQINAWDKILIANNQKILELNEAVKKVKEDQHTLEKELEFIGTQHKELDETLQPLQKEFMKIPQVDAERSQTYLLVENLDTQLKQMSEDLKEIIDNLNEANKNQDTSDPITQIGKILNAHMSSLQWIETSSSTICNKLDELNKMQESFKRDSERSFRSAYYH